MIMQTSKWISEALTATDYKNRLVDDEDFSAVDLELKLDNCSFRLCFFSNKENEVEARAFGFATVPQDKIKEGYELVNNLNRSNPVLRFTLDSDDGTITAIYSFPRFIKHTADLWHENTGYLAIETCKACEVIIGDVYPKIMRALYA